MRLSTKARLEQGQPILLGTSALWENFAAIVPAPASGLGAEHRAPEQKVVCTIAQRRRDRAAGMIPSSFPEVHVVVERNRLTAASSRHPKD